MRNYFFIILIGLLMMMSHPLSAKGINAAGLESYCSGGYYKIPGESESCSRAPCCGTSGCSESDYDRVASLPMPNPQKCMGDGDGRKDKGCAGYVPLCCYEMARTGKFTKCVGYWERLWCAPSQCEEAKRNGASDSECGGCKCAHAFSSYCGNKPPIPLEQRLGGAVQPTAKPTSPPVRPTSPPPVQPTLPPRATTAPTIVIPTTPPPIAIPTNIPVTNAPLEPSKIIPQLPEVYPGIGQVHFDPKSIIQPEKIIALTTQTLEYPRTAIKSIVQVDQQIESWFARLMQRLIIWLKI